MNPPAAGPSVTCIMPTANRRRWVLAAIELFQRQTHANRELLIVDDGVDAVEDIVPRDTRIRYVRIEPGLCLGAKRNRACELAAGDVIVHWDDDDWYPPDRIARQVTALAARNADVCGTSRLYFRDVAQRRAWEYAYTLSGKPWVAGSSLAYRRAAWERRRFRDVQVGEDSHFVWARDSAVVVDLADASLCVAAIHPGNTSPKIPTGTFWTPVDAATIDQLIRDTESRWAPPAPSRGRALMAVASGIGDVIRTTPLIRVMHALGYCVDVLAEADDPRTTELLAGAHEISQIYTSATFPADASYDVACFSYWAYPLEARVRVRRAHRFDRELWPAAGDSACVEQVARELGWQEQMPAPFVVPARRQFDLPAGTVVIHAGCKQGWPWKKWHGFAELADQLEHVAVVGTVEDLDITSTYFAKAFIWPPHVRNYVGQLTLPETAALIQQSAALVCNDSGMQHVGAAVGTPTYVVYGITSPAREGIPLSHVHAVTKQLPCETDCRRQPWGRRDCAHHLECLKTMTATDVLEQLARNGHAAPRRTAPVDLVRYPAPAVAQETLTVAVRMEGGIGDVLMSSVLVRALFDELQRCEIDVFYHQPDAARFVFSGARFVRHVYTASQFPSMERQYDIAVRTLQYTRYAVRDAAKLRRVAPHFASRIDEVAGRFETVRGFADRQPSLDGMWGRFSVRVGRGALDSLAFLGGVDVSRDTELFLAPDPAACKLLVERVGGMSQPYVTVHDGFDNSQNVAAGAATKCWPLEHWQRFIALFKTQYPSLRVVQVGARKSRRIPGVDIDLVEQTTLPEAAWIVKHARLHIDTDSGIVHLARAVHTPALVLFGPTNPGYYGHASNTNISAGDCGDCWWSTPDWLARCPRGLARPACMEAITPERVMEHAAPRLAPAPDVSVQASAVECYDGDRCREHRSTLADICQSLDLPLLPPSQHIKNERTGVYIHASKQWEYLYALDAVGRAAGAEEAQLRIADLGGGRGALAPYLAHRGHRVEAFDLDFQWDAGGDASVEVRFRHWARTVGMRASFGSLYNVPAADGTFDVVTCISVVEHVPYKEYALAEALRILRPGGLLILTFDFANDPERFEDGMRREIFSPARLRTSLARLGVEASPCDAGEVERSARRIQEDGVLGIPDGMTVAGMVVRKGELSAS